MQLTIPEPMYGANRKYNFDELRHEGDSVFITCTNVQTVRDAAYKYAKYNKIKVATRLSDGGLTIYHVGNIE